MRKIKKPGDIEGKILSPVEWSTGTGYSGIARSRWVVLRQGGNPEDFTYIPGFVSPKG